MAAKRIDTEHPDYAEYMRKFKALWDAYYELEERERAKFPDWIGMDHPANDVLIPARKKCCADVKALQKQYAFLFVEDASE